MGKKVSGSITVLLSLILILILAVIGTTLDLARLHVAKVYAYRGLDTAVDAEFTNYCEELYEDYCLFLLSNNQDMTAFSEEKFIESISDYLTDSFPSEEGKADVKGKSNSLIDLQVGECTVEGKTTFLDYDGTIFTHQVQEYMKYEVTASACETILEKLDCMEESKQAIELVRKKAELEESISKIDQKVLDLIQEVEGLTVTKSGFKVTGDKRLATKDTFVKKFCPGEIRPSNVAINHNLIWDSLYGKYVNPIGRLEGIKQKLEKIQEITVDSEKNKERLQEVMDEIERLETLLPKEVQKGETAPTEEQKKNYESYVAFQQEEEQLREQRDALKKEDIKQLSKQIKKETKELSTSADKIVTHIKKAKQLIQEIQGMRESEVEKLTEFGSELANKKTKIDQSMYEGIEEEYGELKNYLYSLDDHGIDTSIIADIVTMQSCLEKNQEILEQLSTLENYSTVDSEEGQKECLKKIELQIAAFSEYTIRPLKFNYDSVSIDTSQKSPFTAFHTLIGEGMLGLVMDDSESLSKETHITFDLPSQQKGTGGVSQVDQEEENNMELAGKLNEGQGGAGIASNLGYYELSYEEQGGIGTVVENVARRFLLNEYGVRHFRSRFDQLEEDSAAQQKDTVFAYEQEYLVSGKQSDFACLKSVVMKTIFVRTILNYFTLLSDRESGKKAKVAATTLVGFTGLQPLILTTKQLILVTWAFEEAFVDVRGLLEGKKIPLFKEAKEMSIAFDELLSISKEQIKKKAAALSETSSRELAWSYQDYIRVYMFLIGEEKLSNRMMDLIQLNMKKRYDSEFSFQQGIVGARVKLSSKIEGKFMGLPGIREVTGYYGNQSTFQVESEYAY